MALPACQRSQGDQGRRAPSGIPPPSPLRVRPNCSSLLAGVASALQGLGAEWQGGCWWGGVCVGPIRLCTLALLPLCLEHYAVPAPGTAHLPLPGAGTAVSLGTGLLAGGASAIPRLTGPLAGSASAMHSAWLTRGCWRGVLGGRGWALSDRAGSGAAVLVWVARR